MSADYLTTGRDTGAPAQRETATCGAPSCWRDAATVSLGDREAVLCETHRKAFLGVSS